MVTVLTLLAFLLTVLLAGFISKLLILYVLYDPTDPILNSPPTPAPAGNTVIPEDETDLLDHLLTHLHPTQIQLFALDLTHLISGILLVGVAGCFSMLYYLVVNPVGFYQFGGVGRRGGR
ncbi:hypothetical protein HDU67_005265, partial [Dinochytrium kinnereticum]